MKNQPKSKEVKNSKKTVTSSAKKIKLSVKLKALIYSAVSLVCVAGIVLGIVFGIKGKGDEPPTNPNGPNSGIKFSASQQLLADDISSNVKYTVADIVTAVPYSSECTVEDLTRFGDNYFAYTDENGNEQFWTYSKQDGVPTKSRNITSSANGFVDSSAVGYEIKGFNGDYVLIANLYSSDPFSGNEYTEVVFRLISIKNPEMPKEIFRFDTRGKEYTMYDDFFVLKDNYFAVAYYSEFNISRLTANWNVYYYSYSDAFINQEYEYQNNSVSGINVQLEEENFKWQFNNNGFYILNEGKYSYYSVSKNGFVKIEKEIELNNNSEIDIDYRFIEISTDRLLVEKVDYIEAVSELTPNTIKEESRTQAGVFTHANYTYELYDTSGYSAEVVSLETKNGYPKLASSQKAFEMIDDHYVIVYQKVGSDRMLEKKYVVSYFDKNQNEVASFETTLENEHIVYASSNTFVTEQNIYQPKNSIKMSNLFDFSGKDYVIDSRQIFNQDYLILTNLAQTKAGIIDVWGNVLIDPTTSEYNKIVEIVGSYCFAQINSTETCIVNLKTLAEPKQIENYVVSNATGKGTGLVTTKNVSLQQYELKNMNGAKLLDGYDILNFNTPNTLAGHEVLEVVTTKDRSKPSHYIIFKEVNKNETSSYVSYAFSESNGQDLSPVADTYATSVDFTAKYWNDYYGEEDIIGTASVTQARHPTVTAQLKDSWYTYAGSIYIRTSDNGSQLGIQDLNFRCYMASIDYPVTSPKWSYELGYNVSSLYSNPTVTLDKSKNYGYKIVFRINYVNETTFLGIVISTHYGGVQMDYAHCHQGGGRMRHEIEFSRKSNVYDSTARKQVYPMFDENVNKVNTFNSSASNPDWEWNEDMNLDTSNSQIYHKPRVNGSASIVAPSVEDVGTALKYGHLSYWRYSVNSSGTAGYLYYNDSYYNDSNVAKSGYTLSGKLNPGATYTFSNTFNDYWYTYFFAYYVENTADIYLNDTLYQDNWGTTQLTNAFSMPTKKGYNFAGWSFTGLVDTLDFYGVEKAHTATFYKSNGTSKVVTFAQDVDEEGNKLGTAFLPVEAGYTSVKFSWLTEPHESEVYIEEVFTPKTYLINLVHDTQRTFTNEGTSEVYYRYDDGFYLDFDFTLRMTETENPITMPIAVGYKTEAQYTFTPDLITYGLTGGEGNVYVTWEDEDEIEMMNSFIEDYSWRTAEAPWTAIHYTVVWENYCYPEEEKTEETKLVAYDEVFSLPVPPSLYHDFQFFSVLTASASGTHYYGDSSSNLTEFTGSQTTHLPDSSYLYFKNLWCEVNPEYTANASHGNVLITNNWRGKQYTVEFEMNGGTAIDSITCYYNSANILGYEPTIPAVPYKVGYNFAGWDVSGMDTAPNKLIYENTTGGNILVTDFTQSVSLDATYSQATFDNLSGTEGTVVFSARWEPATYNIVYDLFCKDSTNMYYYSPGLTSVQWLGTENHPASAVYEQAFYVDAIDISRHPLGWNFSGWYFFSLNLSPEAEYSLDGVNYFEIDNYTVLTTGTCYFRNLGANEGDIIRVEPTWSPNQYNVMINLNGENVTHDFSNYTAFVGSYYGISHPTRIGYTFAGWSVSELADEIEHCYTTPNISPEFWFDSVNGSYYDDDNPNNTILPFLLDFGHDYFFKNFHYADGAIVYFTANWTPNNYNITYHYAKDATFSTFPSLDEINTVGNMQYSKTHTVTYDRYFKTLGVGAIESDTTIVAPTGYKLAGWLVLIDYVLSSTELTNNSVISEMFFEYPNTDVLFDYAFLLDHSPTDKIANMHAYAVYESIQITVKYYAPDPAAAGYNDGACINDLSTYTFQNQATFAYGASVRHSKMLMDGVHFSTNYLISPNLYVEGEVWKSYTTYTFDGTSYYTYAGVSMPWGLSNNLCHDPDNPVFYAYAEYNEDYDGDIQYLQFIELTVSSDEIPGITTEVTGWGVTGSLNQEKIKIPNRYNDGYKDLPVLFINNVAFRHSNLETVILPENLLAIGLNAFLDSEKLSEVIFDENSKIKSILDAAFMDCIALETIEIPDGVVYVGKYAFSGCEELSSIKLPKSLQSIDIGLFEYCLSLEEIEIPNSVTTIDLYAFSNTGLKELNIPASVTSIIMSGLCRVKNLETITVDPANPVYDSRQNCNAIIDKNSQILIFGCVNTIIPKDTGILGIGTYAFALSEIETMEIPEGVEFIADSAFYGCEYLTHVKFPTTLYDIYSRAFSDCYSLNNVILPDSIHTIYDFAFAYCTSLTSIVIPGGSGDTHIEHGAFEGCTRLEFIFLEEGVTYLGNYAFADAGAYAETELCIYLPNTLMYMHSYVFQGAQAGARVYFGMTTDTVNYYASNGYWLEDWNFNEYYYEPEDLNLIYYSTPRAGYNAILGYADFYYYDWVFSVSYSDYNPEVTVKSYIGDDAEATVPAVADYAYFDNALPGLETLNVGQNVKELRFNTSPGSLTALNLTNGLLALGHNTKGLNVPTLTSLYIPASVNSISSNLFKNTTPAVVVVDPDNPYYDSRDNCNAIIETATNTLVAGHSGSTIPSSVVAIGSNALFISQESLDPLEYVIPGNVKFVKSNAISTGNYITTITFEEGLVELETKAIESLNYDFTLNLPSTVSKIGSQVVMFNGGGLYVGISIDSDNPYYHISNGAVVKTATNTLIWANFLTCQLIDDTVTTIGEYAFYTTTYDYDLNIQIPESVTRIEKYAFTNCRFTQPILLTNVKYIGSYAFSGSRFGDVLSLGDKLEVMGEFAFEYSLGTPQEIEIPATLKVIPNYAFERSSLLNEVVLNEGLLKIGTGAFEYSSITRAILPNSLTDLMLAAFYGCQSLSEVHIGPAVKYIGANAFENCGALSTLTIAEGVNERTIGNYAFRDCRDLTTLVIPEGFTTIGEYAFYYCDSLVSVKLPDSLRVIETYAFAGVATDAGAPLEIDFGDGVAFIRDYAFTYANLESIDIGIFEQIGSRVFSYSTIVSFRGIGYRSGDGTITASIGQYAFYSCRVLTDVIIGGSLASIGNSAFNSCTQLTSISLPEAAGACSIGSSAFGYSGLTHIEIPEYYIFNSSIFIGCSSLTHMWVPTSTTINKTTSSILTSSAVTAIYTSADSLRSNVWGTSWRSKSPAATLNLSKTLADYYTALYPDYEFGVSGSTIELENYNGTASEVYIPSGVTMIGSGAFAQNQTITKVVIPNGVTEIDFMAFNGCSNLETIILPETLTMLGLQCFGNCTSLQTIILPESLTTMEQYIFRGSAIQSVYIPKNVTSIDNYVFQGCQELISIEVDPENTTFDSRNNCNAIITTATNTLLAGCKTSTVPNGVVEIGEWAFWAIPIEEIELPDTVKTINRCAFQESGLKSIDLNKVEFVGSSAFYEAPSFTSLIVGDSLNMIDTNAFSKSGIIGFDASHLNHTLTISNSAFAQAASLRYVYLPKMVSLGESVFEESGIETIDFTGVTFVGGSIPYSSFDDCRSLQTVYIGESVTTIGQYAFRNCIEMVEAHLGNSVSFIDTYAFYNCSKLVSIDLPNTLTTISGRAFAYCSSLKDVLIPRSVTSIGICAFQNCTALTAVYISSLATVTASGSSSSPFYNCSSTLKIYTDSSMKQSTWGTYYNYYSSSGKLNVYFNANYSTYFKAVYPDFMVSVSGTTITMNSYTGAQDINLKIPYGITAIKAAALKGLAFNYVYIPGSVTSIASGAFNDTLIDVLLVEEGVVTFSETWFWYCSVNVINLPSTIVSVTKGSTFTGNTVTSSANDFTEWEIDERNENYVVDGGNYGDYVIEKKTGKLVQCLNTTITNLETIPDYVLTIGDYAFYSMSSLTDITIPAQIVEIGQYAFYSCSNVTNISFEEGSMLKKINDYAFFGALIRDFIGDIIIPTSVEYVGKNSLGSGVYSSQEVTYYFGNNLKFIAAQALFYSGYVGGISIADDNPYYTDNDSNIIIEKATGKLVAASKSTIEIPNSIKIIGEWSFAYTSLTELVIPSNIIAINTYAFFGCDELISLTFSEGLKYVGDSAFKGCRNLTQIVLPNSLEYISAQAFTPNISGGGKLNSVYIGSNVKYIGDMVFHSAKSTCVIYCADHEKPADWFSGWNMDYDAPSGYITVVWGYDVASVQAEHVNGAAGASEASFESSNYQNISNVVVKAVKSVSRDTWLENDEDETF